MLYGVKEKRREFSCFPIHIEVDYVTKLAAGKSKIGV